MQPIVPASFDSGLWEALHFTHRATFPLSSLRGQVGATGRRKKIGALARAVTPRLVVPRIDLRPTLRAKPRRMSLCRGGTVTRARDTGRTLKQHGADCIKVYDSCHAIFISPSFEAKELDSVGRHVRFDHFNEPRMQAIEASSPGNRSRGHSHSNQN